jgi:hypothetical protein
VPTLVEFKEQILGTLHDEEAIQKVERYFELLADHENHTAEEITSHTREMLDLHTLKPKHVSMLYSYYMNSKYYQSIKDLGFR